MGRRRVREMRGGPLTLEKYHRFFVDPWSTRLTIDHLNHIISMHGFVKLHNTRKRDIMDRMVGRFDLQPPCRSTLHRAGETWAAVITADDARDDVDAIGWMECPVGGVAAPEPVEREPRPADFVFAGRRARSKRIRSSAYGHKPRGDADSSKKVKEEEDQERLPPPSTPPLWMPSPPLPQSPPSPPHALPPPPPPCCGQPTLAPLPPRPQHFGAPTEPWLSWCLPLLTVPPPPPPPPPRALPPLQHVKDAGPLPDEVQSSEQSEQIMPPRARRLNARFFGPDWAK
ncbi:hypothetical protein GUJ93_ZPchr0003g17521 [Zizania palustris]|uniref:DUF7787 domain-containing protein n=1 Tax=Zizania palustris TaxID=103762 RepID=A0A8J5SHE0_ZIZPA|nr:hypothetical protein GUJ93_ZPchr0003g17521 [Zizania palustris]